MPNSQTIKYVSAKLFGAIGDGIHDDSVPIQLALNHARSSTSYLDTGVMLEPGTYWIPAGTTITVPEGVTLEGSGDDSMIQIGINVPVAAHTAFSVAATQNAIFKNLRFVGPANANGQTIKAVAHAGTSGILSFIGVTSTGTAGVTVAIGGRFLLDLSNDIETASVAESYSYLSDWLWTGGQQPRIIKQIGGLAPSAGAGVAAPEGTILLKYAAGAGLAYLKTGAADTAWSPVVSGAFSGTLTLSFPGTQLTAARNTALVIENDASVAPIAGAANQQVSGMLRWKSFGYNSVTFATESVEFATQAVPVSANPVTGTLEWYKSLNGAAFGAAIMSLTSAGVLGIGSIVATTSITHGGNITSSFAGLMNLNASATGGYYRILGKLAAAATETEVIVESGNTRAAGNIFQVKNNTVELMSVAFSGMATHKFTGTQLDAARNVALTIDNDASQAPLALQANQQVSGGLRFRGFGYNSVSTAIESSDFLIQCRPLTANPTSAVLGFYYSNSGAAYGGYVFSIDSSGSVSCNTVSATSYDASSSDVLRGNFVGTSNIRSTGGALSLRGALAAGDANSDLVFRTTNTRTAGYTAEWQNNTARIAAVSWDGQFTAVSVASAKGANVASANDLPILRDGDVFHITGVTQVNGFPGATHATVPRQAGSRITVIFDGILTLKHDTAPGATFSKLWLITLGDVATVANMCKTFVYDGSIWYET